MNYDAFSGGIEGYIERDGGVLPGGISTHCFPFPPPLIIATTDGGFVNRGYGWVVDRLDGLNCRGVIQGSYDYRFQGFSAVRFLFSYRQDT